MIFGAKGVGAKYRFICIAVGCILVVLAIMAFLSLKNMGSLEYWWFPAIAVCIAIWSFESAAALNRNYIEVYESSIRGSQNRSLFVYNIVKPFELKFDELSSVCVVENSLCNSLQITCKNGTQYLIMLDDAKQAAECIKEKMLP